MKTIGSILLFIIVAVAVKIVYPKLTKQEDKYPPPPGVAVGSREHLKHIASEMKKELPRKIDDDIVLSNVFAREGEMVYTGTLVKYGARELNGPKFRELAHSHLRKKVCGDRDVKRLWQRHDITFSYQFLGNDGFSLGMLSVGPGDC